ncbi:MAG: hypothetical protein PUE90_06140, partial [Bacteroidales bacterium]|nr:hypothetical protein [Bacteroidales bacterium]
GMLAGAAMLFTACQDEEVKAVADGDTAVTITAELPSGVSTRAYADGTTATKLTYAIYETGQNTPLITGKAAFDNLKTTVNVRLANGKTYDMLFWAQADGAPYTFNTATQKVTVDYTAPVGQDEKRDAFFKAETLTVNGTIDKTIQLKRPFAQLNVGAQDFDAAKTAGFEATQTTVKVDNVYTTLNLLDGTVEGETSVTYALANLPTEDFPVSLTPAAKYMSMDYLLVADDKALTNVTFTATNGTHNVERLYTNVPVRRNYRTNIYGNILTEEANFNIEIVPHFDTPDNNFEVAEVATVADLATALEKGGDVLVVSDLDLSAMSTKINITEPTTMTLLPGITIKSDAQPAGIINDSELVINAEGARMEMGRQVVWNHGNITVNGGYFSTNVNNGGTAFLNDTSTDNPNPTITLNNVTVDASFYAVNAYGTVNINGGTISSTSSNKVGTWAYCVKVWGGGTLNIDGATINGVQGGVAVQDADSYATIKNTDIFVRNSDDSHRDAFYTLYAANQGVIEVQSGTFYSDNARCAYASDNDYSAYPNGVLVLKGGKFSAKPLIDNNPDEVVTPFTGFKYQEIVGDPMYTWEVVPE